MKMASVSNKKRARSMVMRCRSMAMSKNTGRRTSKKCSRISTKRSMTRRLRATMVNRKIRESPSTEMRKARSSTDYDDDDE